VGRGREPWRRRSIGHAGKAPSRHHRPCVGGAMIGFSGPARTSLPSRHHRPCVGGAMIVSYGRARKEAAPRPDSAEVRDAPSRTLRAQVRSSCGPLGYQSSPHGGEPRGGVRLAGADEPCPPATTDPFRERRMAAFLFPRDSPWAQMRVPFRDRERDRRTAKDRHLPTRNREAPGGVPRNPRDLPGAMTQVPLEPDGRGRDDLRVRVSGSSRISAHLFSSPS